MDLSHQPKVLTNLAQEVPAATFSQLDRNNDGMISRAEWNNHIQQATAGRTDAHAPMDRGAQRGYPIARTGEPEVGGPRVEPQERQATREREAAATGATGAAGVWQGPQRGYPTARTGEERVGGPREAVGADDFSRFDRDGDGRITRDEWNQHFQGPTARTGDPAVGGPRTESR